MWNDKWSVEGLSLGPANLDLGTLMAESMAATVAGAGISAAGTPAGGSYDTTAGQREEGRKGESRSPRPSAPHTKHGCARGCHWKRMARRQARRRA